MVHRWRSRPAANTAWTAYARSMRAVRQRIDVLHAWSEPTTALPRWRSVLCLPGSFLRLQLVWNLLISSYAKSA